MRRAAHGYQHHHAHLRDRADRESVSLRGARLMAAILLSGLQLAQVAALPDPVANAQRILSTANNKVWYSDGSRWNEITGSRVEDRLDELKLMLTQIAGELGVNL